MLRRLRHAIGRDRREADPLVKVAGLGDRRDAETCLEALEAKGIPADLRDDQNGACELWVRASHEPQARLIMGLSGRSVIRLQRGTADGTKRHRGS